MNKQKVNKRRPTKLTDKFLKVADEIINDDMNAIIYTDEQLLFLINDKLDEKERITDRTFENWKSGSSPVHEKDKLDNFFALLKKALAKQQATLFLNMKKDQKVWQKWAWIIERKFDNWNIRQKVNSDVTTGGKPITYTVVSYKDLDKENEPKPTNTV